MKSRILMVNEFSGLQTGYSTYGREVLRRLHSTGMYDVAELATYVHNTDPRLGDIPWKVYCNIPPKNDKAASQQYTANPSNQFGEFTFEAVTLDFKPHIVFDIRDFWMMEFEDRSPFRKNYHWAIMPTVDAEWQHEQWLATYANADSVFTYSDWSRHLLEYESGGKIRPLGTASPAASAEFKPLGDKETIKRSMGLAGKKIIGTVMRNQRRKLYPSLFAAYREFLNQTRRDDIILYCHTSYPDMGWDIPRLLNFHGLSSKVMFTYVCGKCGLAAPSFFSDAVKVCPRCGELAAGLSNVQRGVSEETLANIMNSFDLYIQLANSEGFGMPQVEAAACGVPIMSTDYSAMSDVVRKLKGYPIAIIDKIPEVETGCLRAVPNIQNVVEIWKHFFGELNDLDRQKKGIEAYDSFREHYNSWDKTANQWDAIFSKVDIEKYEKEWHSSPRISQPEPQLDENTINQISNEQYAGWLISRVLGQPELLGTYMHQRLIRDLNYGVTGGGAGGMYFNDSAFQNQRPTYQPFSRNDAHGHISSLCLRRNHWEQARVQSIQTVGAA